MAPAVQVPTGTNQQPKTDQEKTKKPTAERRPELFCRVKHCNNLPDIPFDPKFIVYPFDTNRFVEYKQTSLEKNFKHDLLTEQDLGVTIDLINPETYEISEYKNVRLSEEDEKLLEDEAAAPQDTKRSRCHNRAISWLKKTEYIATEFNRYGSSSDKTETKVGFGVKKKMRDENLELDRDSQIIAINKTFDSAKKPILSHPYKPGLTPVQTWQVFPDFKLWKYPFAQVTFDADPAPIDKEKEMSQAMIRGVMDESGEQFVAYFLPTEDSMNKRKIDELNGIDYTEGEEYEYTMAREYNWNIKNKATKGYEENYFFVWRDDVVCYNELETRIKLSKRRVKHNATNSKLVVKHIPMNEQEYKVHDIRMTQLEPPQEDEEVANTEQNVENKETNGNDQEEPQNNVSEEESDKEASPQKRRKSASDDESSKASSSSSEQSSASESEESETEEKKKSPVQPSKKVSSRSASSSSEKSSSEASESDSGSSSESDEDEERKRSRKQIFGSDSDSD